MPSRSRLLAKLIPVAEIMLRTRKGGVITSELILRARELGILSGRETPRDLSGLGHVFREAGGTNTGKKRPSVIHEQKGVRQVVWSR